MSGCGKLHFVVAIAAQTAALCVFTSKYCTKTLPVFTAEYIFKGHDSAKPYAGSSSLNSRSLLVSKPQGTTGAKRSGGHERIDQWKSAIFGNFLPLRVQLKRLQKLGRDANVDILGGRLTSVGHIHNHVGVAFKVLHDPIRLVEISFQLHLSMALSQRHQLAVLIKRSGADLHRAICLPNRPDQNSGSQCSNCHLYEGEPGQMLGRHRHLLLCNQIAGSAVFSRFFGDSHSACFCHLKALKAFCSLAFGLALDLSCRWLRQRDAGGEGQCCNKGRSNKSKFQGSLPSFAARHSTSFCGVAA